MADHGAMSCTARVYVADSDDSDNEGGLGNVERVVMRPPGHSGKAKKGHLCFDAIYETGNLGRVDFINDYEYDLFIRPDTCNPRYRFWFNFSVENVHVDQRIIFNIVNLSKTRNLFTIGFTPIVRSSSRPKWQRIPTTYVYYYKSPAHTNNYVLSFAFAFDTDDERYQFALCYPYSYSRCQAYLEQLVEKHPDIVRRESLGKTIQDRQLDMVTITQPEEEGEAGEREREREVKKRTILVMARQQPGESPASYVVQGLIDFLVSKHKIAAELREKLIFKVIPMMNPDGVYLGNYRGNLLGIDLNRVWDKCSPHAHPTAHALKQLIEKLSASENASPLDFVLDIHVSNTMLGFFVVGNAYDSVFRNERHIVFPKMLAQNTKDFSQENTMYNKDGDKAGTARMFLSKMIENENTNIYSLEVSMYGYKPDPKSDKIVTYTEENYILHGRSICRALWDYYKISGHIEGCEILSEELLSVTLCAKKVLECASLLQHYIIDHRYVDLTSDPQDILNAGEPEKILEISEFSMLRLNDIAEQRNIYSSVDDIVYAHDSDSDFDEPYENRCKPDVQVVPAAVKHEPSSPEGGFAKFIRPCQEEDELATARDIAEFERNKHLSKPCNTLDGFSDRDAGYLHDEQLGLGSRRKTPPAPGGVSSLQVVGLNCMKPAETGGDEAPSRPLSRASRAESMGSLADFSGPGFNQPSPADYEYSHRNRQAPDSYLRGSGRPNRRSVGGGGTLLQGRSQLSSCPPLLTVSPYSHNYQNSRQKLDADADPQQKCNYIYIQLNSRDQTSSGHIGYGCQGYRSKSSTRENFNARAKPTFR